MAQAGAMASLQAIADIKRFQKRIAEITDELIALGRIRPLPTLTQAKAGLREILDVRNEPETYEERRPILDKIIDLRLGYYKENLTITSKVPIPAAHANNRNSRIRADPQSQSRDDCNSCPSRAPQNAGGESEVVQQSFHELVGID